MFHVVSQDFAISLILVLITRSTRCRQRSSTMSRVDSTEKNNSLVQCARVIYYSSFGNEQSVVNKLKVLKLLAD